MPPAIRDARSGDIPAITRIYARAVREGTASFEIEPPTEQEMARRFQTLVDRNYPYVVAELDGALAGYAYAGPYRPRPAYRWSVEDSVYVDPAAQRRGVGRALLEQLIAASEARDLRQMIAVIGDSAQIPSIELHRAAGFHYVGNIQNVGFKFGRWLDTVLMQRTLGSGATTLP
ncbi:MAG TPA: GNAT family N-acetyltransferase [Xanthobacteraceae bacterium]|nr:GNAT family N-acetyltransferase [Xanthobacteraceae bacterium]